MTPADGKKGVETLTAAGLDMLEELHEAATPGEWICETRTDARLPAAEEAVAVVAPRGWCHTVLFGDVRVRSNVADRNLAVATRNALPSLLALARRGLGLEAAEPSKADRCVNCAFGSRACRQCRDRHALAAALAECGQIKADRTEILDRVAATPLNPAAALEVVQSIQRDFGVEMRVGAPIADAQAARDATAEGAKLPHRPECEGGENCICKRRDATAKGGPA